ncbi:siphovirus Gp157 family protein [Staphylococcus xylosus]
MTSLFDLSQKFKDILSMLEEGYSLKDIQDTLDSIEADMNTKVDNTAALITMTKGDVEVIEKEIKRLQALKKQKLNFEKTLKIYLQHALNIIEKDNYRTSKNYIFKRKNAPVKEVVDEKLIPNEYLISQAPKLNSKRITDDLKAGKEIPGVRLKQTTSVVVR